jgi:hypothetical protein
MKFFRKNEMKIRKTVSFSRIIDLDFRGTGLYFREIATKIRETGSYFRKNEVKIRENGSYFRQYLSYFREYVSYFREINSKINENGGGKQKPTIETLEVDLSVPGEATIRIKRVTNAIAFVHQYTTEPPNEHTRWYGEGTSLSRYTFKGLESEKRHWFRVVAIGYFGLRGYSPIVSKVIQ